ncbi:MAG: EF-hand domain-containing protein [archaeon]|nr:EF-hand domain-containing protein [archaeon]MDA1129955.1 EF-hand domain-containing protein [archaeon]
MSDMSYSELQAIKAEIENSFAKSKGQLSALSDSQLGVIAAQYGIKINPSNRMQTLSLLESNQSIMAWCQSFSKGDVAAAVAAAGTVGVATQINNSKEELQQKARNKIANASSSVVDKIERKASNNPMVEMMRKNFGQSLIQAGYSVPQLTQMLDSDADGIITQSEIMLLIVKMTGTPPPPWVVTTIFEILDANQDGVVTVEEWWAFLEEMGFENNVVKPEPSPTEAPVVTVVEEIPDIDETFEEIDNTEEETPLQQVVESPIPIAETMNVEDSSSVILDENVNTNNEKLIKELYSSRLSSEERVIIAKAKSSICTIKVERIERTMMVTDHYRGGHSILGILDGGPYKVLIMLPKSENDVVTKFLKGDTVVAEAKVISWSSGLKIAKFAGTDAKKA